MTIGEASAPNREQLWRALWRRLLQEPHPRWLVGRRDGRIVVFRREATQ